MARNGAPQRGGRKRSWRAPDMDWRQNTEI
jgi:hypothetical protein